MAIPLSVRPLVRCALLIVVIFLYHDPVLIYPRIGPSLCWVLHSGMTIRLHSGVLCYRGYHIYSFIIHSFGHFYSAPSSPLLLRGAPDYSTDTVSEFHAEAHRQLQVKDLPGSLRGG